MNAARLIIFVSAGIIPGERPTIGKSFSLTSKEWEEATDVERAALLTQISDAAHDYARALQDPARYNWVEEKWVWL